MLDALAAMNGSSCWPFGKRRSLLLTTCWLGLLGTVPVSFGAPAVAGVTFEPYELATGAATRQIVVPGFLLGGRVAELAVLQVDENDNRQLQVYALHENAWVPQVNASLGSEVLFVDVANIGGRDRLLTYEPGQLNWFDPAVTAQRRLFPVTSNFSAPNSNAIAHVDISLDLNGDNRDDLVIPDAGGFWVFVQMSDGSFADPVKLGHSAKPGSALPARGYRYTPWDYSRLHQLDYDGDGRNDLVYWNEDHFEVHGQSERGLFNEPVRVFTTRIAFDSDDPAALAAPHGVRDRRRDHMPSGEMAGRVLHSLQDYNGDGVGDLGVFSLEIAGMWSAYSTYEVHFGSPTPGGIVFAPEVSATVYSAGVPVEFGHYDFDHNGQRDMMFSSIKVGVGFFKTLGMLALGALTKSVSADLEFYRMREQSYPKRPDTTRKIKVHPGKSGDKATYATALVGEVNGDSHLDLLVQKGRKELQVFLGVPERRLFTKRPQKVTLNLPLEEHIWLVDLNGDGRQDILAHHLSGSGPPRVTTLIARGP